jgi:hypothetical protein
MEASIEKLIKSKVAYINGATNDMVGCADWRKLKSLIKRHIKETKIVEISFKKFQANYGLKENYSKEMLIEINKDLFQQ